jgi:isoleucyl-tRNA synthetase
LLPLKQKLQMINPEILSVHLTDFPVANDDFIDKALEEKMQIAQQISSMVLALRRKVSIKVRQPLQMLMIPVTDPHQREAIEAVQPLILNEVNVKTIKYVDNAAEILVKRIKPDFKKLGPRYGKIMKDLATAISTLSQQEIALFEKSGTLNINVAGQTAEITTNDVEIFSEDIPGWLVANEGKLTVALDITVTEELKREGIARELVNRIQNIRKSNGYEITDKIKIVIQRESHAAGAIEEYSGYIAAQVLATNILLVDLIESGEGTELDMDDFLLRVKVEKE